MSDHWTTDRDPADDWELEEPLDEALDLVRAAAGIA